MKLEKEVEELIGVEVELRTKADLKESQSHRLAGVEARLSEINAAHPGIIEHVRRDIAQGMALQGHRNAQHGLSLARKKLFPLAKRTARGFVVSAEAIEQLNREGAAIGRHTQIALEQNKLCTRLENGDLLLPWEWATR